MADNNVDAIVAQYVSRYGPLITARQAAEISCRKLQTVYDWSSRGLLDCCRAKRRGVLLLMTEPFVRFVLEENEA